MQATGIGLCVVLGLALGSTALAADGDLGFEGFPFLIPYDGLADGSAPADLVKLDAPAGEGGFVQTRGDNFVLSESSKPIRFWATNLTFGGCFPPHDVADRLARRLATLGVNCVRFHHMDASGYPRGIWRNQGWGDFVHSDFHPEALDRLDYLIAQLKKNGVYADLNLHVSRTYGPADGFPAVGPGESVPSYGKGMDQFYPRAIDEQKRYARMLLGHVNRYTGNAYAAEPAVAQVEISNEDGLLHEWRGGGLDHLPAAYVQELQRQWNEWLREKHGSTADLSRAWARGAVQGDDTDLITAQGARRRLEAQGGAQATLTSGTVAGREADTVTVSRASPTSWHVQYHVAPLTVEQGVSYVLRVSLRANRNAEVSVGLRMDHAPWQSLGLAQSAQVTSEWQDLEFYFAATQSDAPNPDGSGGARISIGNLSSQGLQISVAGVSLKKARIIGLGDNEELGTVPWIERSQLGRRTEAVRLDLVTFLRDTEAAYWKGMAGYLHNELGARMAVTGTAVGYTTTYMAAETVDFVDSHAYWQHPSFPGRPWDPNNWIIRQVAMVDSPDRATLGRLAVRRAFGMPYTVTEYNHPSPNRYEAEGFPLAAVYGSFQKWDGVYPFNYDNGGRWEVDHFTTYFSTTGNPVKLAIQPACSDILRRGRVSPPPRVKVGALSLQQRLDHLAEGGGWPFDPWPEGIGPLDWLTALVGVDVGRGVPQAPPGPGADLSWNVTDGKGLVRWTDKESAGMIGFGAGTALDAGGLRITPGNTSLDGFSVVILNSVDGQELGQPGRYLLTAMSRCANRNMGWNEEGTSVGSQWGEGPTLCEGVPLRIGLPTGAGSVFPLNPDGTRTAAVGGDGGAFQVGAGNKTLWYEIVIQ